MMECFGGGIRHTLSSKCVEDGHQGAKETLEEFAKHKPGFAQVEPAVSPPVALLRVLDVQLQALGGVEELGHG
jgi:hypothetical protein